MFLNVDQIINDRYRIIEQIGEGGFGEVYKAEDLSSKTTIAIKCLLPRLAEDIPDYVALFKREAHAAQQISDDHLVKIFSIEETTVRESDINFITMEFAPDGDLDSYIRRQETFLSFEQLSHWMHHLIKGLRAINAKIIHRDIKPKNILLFGSVLKISDFGISKFIEQSTRTLTFKGIGTASYKAPEVWENKSATTLVDMYSMGLVFYYLASLKHPFLPIPAGQDPYDYLKNKHLYDLPINPREINKELADKLSLMIMKMIEKRPERRFKNTDEVSAFLDKITLTEEQSVNGGVKEIVGLMHKTEETLKKREINAAQKRKQEMEEGTKKNSLFSFGCDEILLQFDQLIDEVNAEAATVKIGKRPSKTISRYEQEYSFHGKSIKTMLERTDTISNPANIIAWGYCYIDQYKDGFNLLLQLDPREVYPKWLIIRTRDNPITQHARFTDPHAMLDLPRFEDALRGLHAIHIYYTELKPFSLDEFKVLAKKLASS